MRYLIFYIFASICVLVLNAQDVGLIKIKQVSEAKRRAHYKSIVTDIFKDDELFVLFYLDLALVVDPTKESQFVERITTENPWEALIEYIQGKSNIYFCPSCNQLNKAIEYMPCPLDIDILMSDRYGMYRLSSPEELFKNRGGNFRNVKHRAVVFGGLKYNEEGESNVSDYFTFRGDRGAFGGYSYLKSTYDEAKYIDSIFRRNFIETALLTGKDGTEHNFAQIPKYNVDILHIASHGFYEPDNDNADATSIQEWMMSHAGLVLSGAENYTKDRANDGKLTAYEISQTDLSGVNLVVLSACDTGLGDIKENDVYGLLKGFKKAGAGTLLVTLSEVDDKVTSLIMKRFYDNIFRGDNPRRALENAQRYVRLIRGGEYNKPEYWMPFVLVDDLDRSIGDKVSEDIINTFLSDIVKIQDIYSDNRFLSNWKGVKNKNDVGIQICSYESKNKTDYIAVLWFVSKKAKCTRLFSTKTDSNGRYISGISCRNGGKYYTESSRNILLRDLPLTVMDSIVWSSLLSSISPKQTIYFQPSGLLNLYPIENCPSVYDVYKIYRVSSLSRIQEQKVTVPKNYTIALYGGIDYDNTVDSIHRMVKKTRTEDYIWYLPGTLKEVVAISKVFENSGYETFMYKDSCATLISYEKLPDGCNIIHFSSSSGSYKDYYGSFKFSSLSDYLFALSAISLSGANVLPFEDGGCLTGYDIIRKKLNSVELVSLACAPDVGVETTGSNWNLCSAFKTAGAESILFSGSPVGDEATCLLMTEFYKNWIGKKMTKYAALEAAKKSVQSRTEKGWDDPKYWAAFILLDALD